MLHSRAGYRSARPTPFIAHIRLATHGRSIQAGPYSWVNSQPIDRSQPPAHVRFAPPKATDAERCREMTR
jgi:hypothetical protein